nr:Ycf37 [Sahlingia subintegra]
MNQLLSTIYLIILLSFLSLFSYYISKELLKNIQEENIFNVIQTIDLHHKQQLDPLLHLNLVKVYSNRSITDAAIYELKFLIKSKNKFYSKTIMSNLYVLMGQNLEILQKYDDAVKSYCNAIEIVKDNKTAIDNLKKLQI